jgi:hypothetical protein
MEQATSVQNIEHCHKLETHISKVILNMYTIILNFRRLEFHSVGWIKLVLVW